MKAKDNRNKQGMTLFKIGALGRAWIHFFLNLLEHRVHGVGDGMMSKWQRMTFSSGLEDRLK